MMSATVAKDVFGKTKDGRVVSRYTFTNKNKVTVRIIDYGCVITDILVPDKNGNVKDINLGFDDMEGYETWSRFCLGAVCGRVANRIADSKFTLDGNEYKLTVNEAPNHIHGGINGFHKVVNTAGGLLVPEVDTNLVMWNSCVEGDRLVLRYVSADGEEGYPGEVTTTVSYQLSDDNTLSIEYSATTNKATPFNLTNHACFNLAGHDSPNLDGHVIQILADHYTAQTEALIPTGELASVEGTPLDLRKLVSLSDRMKEVDRGLGFGHNYCVGEGGKLKFVARLEHQPSGRVVDVCTTEPGLEVYSSYVTDTMAAKGGGRYQPSTAISLEAQHYPDSIHHDNFPNTVLRPGEVYHQTTTYKFGVTK